MITDDVVIEGVHLVPEFLDIEKFKRDASIHFFILTANKEVHKERFVKWGHENKTWR